jgi:hypothetical protein
VSFKYHSIFPVFPLAFSKDVAIESYKESSVMAALNASELYNAMIYPFTRSVIYGVIWYQGKQQNFDILYRYS